MTNQLQQGMLCEVSLLCQITDSVGKYTDVGLFDVVMFLGPGEFFPDESTVMHKGKIGQVFTQFLIPCTYQPAEGNSNNAEF